MNKILDFTSPKRLAWAYFLFTFFSLPSTSMAGFNAKPVVDAGSNQTVYAGDLVNLTATATDPEGATLRYLWSYKARNLINLSIAQPAHLATSFIAPDTNKTIKIRLIFSAIDPQNAKAACLQARPVSLFGISLKRGRSAADSLNSVTHHDKILA